MGIFTDFWTCSFHAQNRLGISGKMQGKIYTKTNLKCCTSAVPLLLFKTVGELAFLPAEV